MLTIRQLEKGRFLFMALLIGLLFGWFVYDVGFAGTLVKNPDMTYTYQPSPEETMTLQKAEAEWGPEVMLDLIDNWIQDRARYFAEQEKQELKEDLDKLTEADRQKILDMLKGKRMIR